MSRVLRYFAILTAVVAAALGVASQANAAVSTPSPANQIGILVPYNATVAGPYVPYPVSPFTKDAGLVGANSVTSTGAEPVVITTTNGGCTWTETNVNATAVSAGQLDGVVYSFITRRFGFETSAASAAGASLSFVYNGVPIGCPAA